MDRWLAALVAAAIGLHFSDQIAQLMQQLVHGDPIARASVFAVVFGLGFAYVASLSFRSLR